MPAPSTATPNPALEMLARVMAALRSCSASGVQRLPVQCSLAARVRLSDRIPATVPATSPAPPRLKPTHWGQVEDRSGGGAGEGLVFGAGSFGRRWPLHLRLRREDELDA